MARPRRAPRPAGVVVPLPLPRHRSITGGIRRRVLRRSTAPTAPIVRTPVCDDCVVSFIVGREPEDALVVDADEARAVRLLGRAGLVPGHAPRGPGQRPVVGRPAPAAGRPCVDGPPCDHGVCPRPVVTDLPALTADARAGLGRDVVAIGVDRRPGRGGDRRGRAVRRDPGGSSSRAAAGASMPTCSSPTAIPPARPSPTGSCPVPAHCRGAWAALGWSRSSRDRGRPVPPGARRGRSPAMPGRDHYADAAGRPRTGSPSASVADGLAGPGGGRRQRPGRPGGRPAGRTGMDRSQHAAPAARPRFVVRARLGGDRRPARADRRRPAPRHRPKGAARATAARTACPTGALVDDGVLDARRCLAWLVQAPGTFPVEFRDRARRPDLRMRRLSAGVPGQPAGRPADPAAAGPRPTAWPASTSSVCWRPPMRPCSTPTVGGTSPEREPRLPAAQRPGGAGQRGGRRRPGDGRGPGPLRRRGRRAAGRARPVGRRPASAGPTSGVRPGGVGGDPPPGHQRLPARRWGASRPTCGSCGGASIPATFAVLTASSHPDAAAFDAEQAERGIRIERVASRVLAPTPGLIRTIRAGGRPGRRRPGRARPRLPPRRASAPVSGSALRRAAARRRGGRPRPAPGASRSLLAHVVRDSSLVISAGGYPAAEARRAVRGRGMPPGRRDPARGRPRAVPPLDDIRALPDPGRPGASDGGATGGQREPAGAPQGNGRPDRAASVLLADRFPDLTVAIAGRGRDGERLAGRVAESGRTGAPARRGVRRRPAAAGGGGRRLRHAVPQPVAGSRAGRVRDRLPGGRRGRRRPGGGRVGRWRPRRWTTG